MTKVER